MEPSMRAVNTLSKEEIGRTGPKLKRSYTQAESTITQIALPSVNPSSASRRLELSSEDKVKRGRMLLRTATDGTEDLDESAKEIALGTVVTTNTLNLSLSHLSVSSEQPDLTSNLNRIRSTLYEL